MPPDANQMQTQLKTLRAKETSGVQLETLKAEGQDRTCLKTLRGQVQISAQKLKKDSIQKLESAWFAKWRMRETNAAVQTNDNCNY